MRQNKSSILAVIPARGGSKGIPNKNIRPLNNKPLIAYSIEAGKKSQLVDDLITTTDCDKIARIAAEYGSEVLMRPIELARDETPIVPVVLHVLDVLQEREKQYEYVVLLQPTSPLRTAQDIDEALKMLLKSDADAVISVQRVQHEHPARLYRIDDRRLSPYESQWELLNRQDLPPVYNRNGAVYAIREKILREQKTFFPPNNKPYIMPKIRSLSIDDEIDFLIAEFLMNRFH